MRVTTQTGNVLHSLVGALPPGRYGLEIARETALATGTVYPILRRLEAEGWVTSDWERPTHMRRPLRRFYRLTDAGHRQQAAERRSIGAATAPRVHPADSTADHPLRSEPITSALLIYLAQAEVQRRRRRKPPAAKSLYELAIDTTLREDTVRVALCELAATGEIRPACVGTGADDPPDPATLSHHRRLHLNVDWSRVHQRRGRPKEPGHPPSSSQARWRALAEAQLVRAHLD